MQNYSNIQKFLHDIVLKKKFINRSLFEIEKIIFLKNKNIENNSHIFVTGLPRSGTTSILNFIYSTNHYASLTYRNMPFVLSPNISKFFFKKSSPLKERLHGDGITFDIDSPEAFDEFFFKNDEKFINDELINFINLVLCSERKDKYLSKNNLNFKRIDLILSILPHSMFLIPIREPLQHANSLLNQHLHFTRLQLKDDFIKRYMSYLGHNEFGLNHKSWNSPIYFKELTDINYWLEQWSLFYENIFNNYQSRNKCFFIIYEELTNPNYVKMVLKKLSLNDVNKSSLNFFKNSNKKKINIDFEKKNYDKAKDIYTNFRQKFISGN